MCVCEGGGADFFGRTLFNGFIICNFLLMKRTNLSIRPSSSLGVVWKRA